MKLKSHIRRRPKGRGFTLVEVLVVIVIIISLAAVTMSITRAIKSKAQASKHLSDIRQAGSLLLGKANETNARCSFFAGGNGNYSYAAYYVLCGEMGLQGHGSQRAEIMFWDTTKLAPGLTNEHWNCRAVNFQDVTYPDGTKTTWTQETIKDSADRSGNVKSISLSSVARPASYPLLIDSSTAAGLEIFRINEGNGDCVGLRDAGKASAFMFDGSARAMDKADLKKAGFTKAYDNSVKPPKSIRL